MAEPEISRHSYEHLHLLDDQEEWSSFSKPSDQLGCWESSVVIEGMHCAACALTVEGALLSQPGVLRAEVSAASHRAKVIWSQAKTKPSDWIQSLQRVGYGAIPANDAFASERRKLETRKALWRWSVAGFCMMQVMMYAYPAYTARPGDLSMEMEHLLRWASWVLSLPVIFFSCGVFFQSAWRDTLQGRIGMDLPVALGMLITFGVSTAGTFEPQGIFGREVYFDSLTMFVFFLLTGRWLEMRLREKTAGALDALMNRLPESVERIGADGAAERIAARRVRAGDVLRVFPGESFVADGVLLSGNTMVDEALLSGESHPLQRTVGEAVVAGSHNLSASVTMRVTQTGSDTRFAQIVSLMQSAATTRPESAMLADRLAKPFLVAVLLASLGACAWWWSTDPGHALMVAVSVLVVTCPCALSLATPAAMLAAAGALAREGVLVRKLSALESLSNIDTMVFDKTGTLTQDRMELTHIKIREGFSEQQVLLMAASLARHSLHPASRAITDATNSSAGSVWKADSVREEAGQGVSGSANQVDAMSIPVELKLGSARFCSIPDSFLNQASEGPCVYLSDSSGWLATFSFGEVLREKVATTVTELKKSGISTHILSGDNPDSVDRIAQQIGVESARGGCSPAEKLEASRGLQKQGYKVAMVGDGMNDGPVLAGSHVSFSFGRAVPIAQSQADFVVLGDQFERISQAVKLARKTMKVVKQNLIWAMIYNASCIPLAVMGYLPAWLAGLGMAGSSIVVVANALRLSRPMQDSN